MAAVRLLLPRFQPVFVAMTPVRPAASAHPRSGGAEKKFNEEQTHGRHERDSKQTQQRDLPRREGGHLTRM